MNNKMSNKVRLMISIQAGFSAVITYYYCLYEQLMFPNWSIVTALLCFSDDTGDFFMYEHIKRSLHRVFGSLVGIYIGLFGHFIIASTISDAFVEIIYLILFCIFSVSFYLSSMYEGFKLCLISSTLVLVLTMEKHDPFDLSIEYASSIMIGVVIASVVKSVFIIIEYYYFKKRIDW